MMLVEAVGKKWEIKTAKPASTSTVYESTKGDMWVDVTTPTDEDISA